LHKNNLLRLGIKFEDLPLMIQCVFILEC